jgi:exodeoxyribonuclease V alpha subunit
MDYLTENQIIDNVIEILQITANSEITDKVKKLLKLLLSNQEIKERILNDSPFEAITAYYSNSLYFDEDYLAKRVRSCIKQTTEVDLKRVENWLTSYCLQQNAKLSAKQQESIIGIVSKTFSILTGGPGCGKTTTTKVLVKLLLAMKKEVILAAPTGRAAQRMTEVIGKEAKTIHRLLEWSPTKAGFKKSEDDLLKLDFLIIDECSMLDVNLAASLLEAVPQNAQILFIGDPDQLPSVGAGNVLFDLLETKKVPRFHLSEVFRQAAESNIVKFAHQINQGEIPKIESPFYKPYLWQEKQDCLFIDAEEATLEQIRFLQKAKLVMQDVINSGEEYAIQTGDKITGTINKQEDEIKINNLLVQEFANQTEIKNPVFIIPEKFKHVDLEKLHDIQNKNFNQQSQDIEELRSILKSIHPWSALHYGMSALDVLIRTYTSTIPKYFGKLEIQILTPQVRGSLGAINLNQVIQEKVNPQKEGLKEIKIGDKIFREKDRVIQTRNNYDLGVYNGDIGTISNINLENYTCNITFGDNKITYKKEDLAEDITCLRHNHSQIARQ